MASSAALQLWSLTRTIGQVPPTEVDAETGETTIKGSESDKYAAGVPLSLVGLLALAALVSGGLSFYFIVSGLVDLTSVLVCVVGATVVVQKHKLRELGGFRGQHNHLRTQVNQLHVQNQKLTATVDRLTASTTKLTQVQTDLDKVAQASGQSVNQLVNIVQENGQLQTQILDHLQAEVLGQIMTAVLATDADRDFCLNQQEVETLVLRLKNLPGVDFNEASFRAFLKSDRGELTLSDVCAIARNLQDETQTMIASRGAVFESPTHKNTASHIKNRTNLFSPRHHKNRGAARGGEGDDNKNHHAIFQFKPRSFLERKKVLGLF